MKYLLAIIFSCLLISCGDSKPPPDIIPPPQMETILWQLIQTDEYTATAFVSDSTKNINTERIKRYRQVFQLNNTSKEAFEKSYNYYIAHPDMTKTMFDSLSARAARRNDTAQAPHPNPAINKLNIKPVPVQSK